MEIFWLAVLGFLLAGYFVLGGYDYGVQLLAPRTGRPRDALNAIGGWFLGNEVWLVAFAGVLFAAFPFLEGILLSGLYPLITFILLGLVVGNAAVQLRSRARWRGWDVLVAAGGLVPALGWGLVVGVLFSGVPLYGGQHGFAFPWPTLASPFVLLCGLTGVALFAAHGAAFLTLRGLRVRATPYLNVATAGVLGASAAGFWQARAVVNPGVTIWLAVLLLGALLIARTARAGWAFAATSVSAALPVALIGAATHPYLLVSTVSGSYGVTVADGAADGATLSVLTGFGVAVIPIILSYQAWSWMTFRRRDGLGYF